MGVMERTWAVEAEQDQNDVEGKEESILLFMYAKISCHYSHQSCLVEPLTLPQLPHDIIPVSTTHGWIMKGQYQEHNKSALVKLRHTQ